MHQITREITLYGYIIVPFNEGLFLLQLFWPNAIRQFSIRHEILMRASKDHQNARAHPTFFRVKADQ